VLIFITAQIIGLLRDGAYQAVGLTGLVPMQMMHVRRMRMPMPDPRVPVCMGV